MTTHPLPTPTYGQFLSMFHLNSIELWTELEHPTRKCGPVQAQEQLEGTGQISEVKAKIGSED